MPQVLVWKCPHTGKLFEDRSKYTAHLRKQGRERLLQRKLDAAAREWEQFNHRMGQVRSIQELTEFISNNWERFALNGMKQGFTKEKGLHKLEHLEFQTVRWDEFLSNTHSCPKGGVTNFMSKRDKPNSYPGWRARIVFKVNTGTYRNRGKEYPREGYGSDYFAGSSIKTGSGGGSGTGYAYDINLWAHDFPGMYEQLRMDQWMREENRKRDLAWRALGGTDSAVHVDSVPDDWQCLPLPPLNPEIQSLNSI
jgi:hypothetical protein